MDNVIKVKISDYRIGKSPECLITLGLGSCVGVAIYDKCNKVGGLSHIMLPDSSKFTKDIKVQKFADLAIPHMVDEIRKKDDRAILVAKIAGGASMFNFPGTDPSTSIGYRNVIAVENKLKELNIPILARSTGGNIGRTMIVDLETFIVNIKTANKEIISL